MDSDASGWHSGHHGNHGASHDARHDLNHDIASDGAYVDSGDSTKIGEKLKKLVNSREGKVLAWGAVAVVTIGVAMKIINQRSNER